jgi:molecular chaperone GrpE (heat shock protein)
MDGLQDEARQVDEGAAQQAQGASAQVSGEGAAGGGAGGEKAAAAADEGIARARADYEAALKERDERIAALEGEITEAAKTAEAAERLRAEMDELRRRGDEERVGFELQIAGARNVKAARALLGDYDDDIDKLKAAEPWLFGAGATAPAQAGATGLPNAGATTDEGAQMRRWRRIAGIDDEEE